MSRQSKLRNETGDRQFHNKIIEKRQTCQSSNDFSEFSRDQVRPAHVSRIHSISESFTKTLETRADSAISIQLQAAHGAHVCVYDIIGAHE